MKIGAFILSRLDSSRLPAKAMLNFNNKPMIEHIICSLIDLGVEPIVVTSDRDIDQPIVDSAIRRNVKYFRGSPENVALRICNCLKSFNLDHFMRINGDSPFIDSGLIKKGKEAAESNKFDLVSNIIKRTYPYGISMELVRAEKYVELYENFETAFHFEHPTSYLYENLSDLKYCSIENEKDFSTVSLTVDTLQDYIRMTKIISLKPKFQKLNLDEKVEFLNSNKLN